MGGCAVSDFLPFVVIGIVSGSVYGLTATGLVLTYKTSGIFNFAQGSIAALAAFAFYFLHVQHGWPWPLTMAVCLLVVGPGLGLALERLALILADVSDTLKIAATIGIILIVLSLGQIWFPSTPAFPSYLPTRTYRLFGVNVGWDQTTIFIISLVLVAALYYFFRFVRMGMAMRAVVDDPNLISMTGENPARVRRWAWVIGTTFAALSGVLLAPSINLDASILTLLVVQAFGAAAIGYFSNLPLTYVGGLLIGVLAALSTKYVTQVPSLAGLPPSLPFIILFIALIVTPRARLASRRFVPSRSWSEAWYAPWRVRLLCGGLFLVLVCFVPAFAGDNLAAYSAAVVDIILFLSLGLLIRNAGQVSLCQYAFAAVGAAAMAHFSTSFGLPWLVAVLLAGLVAIPVGAIVAIPAIRLTGVFLALATLGFGVLLQQMFYTQNWMFGPNTNGVAAARPHLGSLGTDTGYYYVAVVFAVLAVALTLLIRNGRLGRILHAMSDSPLALETQGATVNVARVIVFCIASFMAAVSGALTAGLFHYAVGSEFDSFGSLTLVCLVVIITIGDPWYAIIAAGSLELIPAYLNLGNITSYLQILFGVSAVLAPITTLYLRQSAPNGVRRLADRVDRMLGGKPPVPVEPALAVGALDTTKPVPREGLEVRDLSVRFGGTAAVSHFDLVAPTAMITGLIGPNGAGKTTTFNACCGLLKPTSGRIILHGTDVSGMGPSVRARKGLGRTFQRVELFNSLSVRQNIAIGREAILAGGNPVRQVVGRRGDTKMVAAAVQHAAEVTGISDLLDVAVSDITTGQRRLVELARVLAGPFDMILLDEPSSGLDGRETEAFGRILSGVVAERGVGILIVEHDMSLVRQVCDRVSVLDFGQKIFEGTPAEMLSSPVVRAAYLGSEAGAGGSELAAVEAAAQTSTPR
jgi:ABC-type branched-subunit amino acid transport system ATPase component/branched-subunit amino acid ABC-type transport system permease component